jgi:putative lipoic acid-binding regulatory protein
MTAKPEETLLTFPCRYTLKVVAAISVDIDWLLTQLQAHIAALQREDITVKTSSQGKYASFSIVFTAETQAQLDAIYQTLTACPDIVFVL